MDNKQSIDTKEFRALLGAWTAQRSYYSYEAKPITDAWAALIAHIDAQFAPLHARIAELEAERNRLAVELGAANVLINKYRRTVAASVESLEARQGGGEPVMADGKTKLSDYLEAGAPSDDMDDWTRGYETCRQRLFGIVGAQLRTAPPETPARAAVPDDWLAAIDGLMDFAPTNRGPLPGMVRGGEYVLKGQVIKALLDLSRQTAAPTQGAQGEPFDVEFKRLADTILQATTNGTRLQALRGMAELFDKRAAQQEAVRAAPEAVMEALTDGIPLQEPVNIGKALRAHRLARVCLSGGTGPVACVMLVNIQLTSWADGPEKAEAYAKGYNDALKHYRGALVEVAHQASAKEGGEAAVNEK